MPSVLWRCWLGGRKGVRLVKNMEWWGAGMVICLEWGANDLHMVQLMPLPPHHLLLQQNPEWFILLVPAYPGCPGKKAVKRLCVCVCVFIHWHTSVLAETFAGHLHLTSEKDWTERQLPLWTWSAKQCWHGWFFCTNTPLILSWHEWCCKFPSVLWHIWQSAGWSLSRYCYIARHFL